LQIHFLFHRKIRYKNEKASVNGLFVQRAENVVKPRDIFVLLPLIC